MIILTARNPTVALRRRLGPAERRAQIVSSAAAAFVVEGFVGTSVVSIAASADVSVRIVYRHFRSKEALYRAVIERSAALLAPVFDQPVGPYGLDTRTLLAAGRADIDGFRVLWRHAVREREFADVADRLRARAVACARAGLESWTPPAALDWAAAAVVGYQVEAVVTWLEHGRPEEDARFVKATRAALRAGVRSWSTG
jgi:AcrR family transcriptional regulator